MTDWFMVNWMDANDELNEAMWQMDIPSVIRWTNVLDTFAEMI